MHHYGLRHRGQTRRMAVDLCHIPRENGCDAGQPNIRLLDFSDLDRTARIYIDDEQEKSNRRKAATPNNPRVMTVFRSKKNHKRRRARAKANDNRCR